MDWLGLATGDVRSKAHDTSSFLSKAKQNSQCDMGKEQSL